MSIFDFCTCVFWLCVFTAVKYAEEYFIQSELITEIYTLIFYPLSHHLLIFHPVVWYIIEPNKT